jgi:hypothetical protein
MAGMRGDLVLGSILALGSLTACNVVVTSGAGFGGGAGSSAHAGSSSGAPAPPPATVCMPGATGACYDGPAGTEGVGRCKAGVETCAADGSGYGACAGEVLPAQEVCGSGRDDDCNGQPLPCAHVPPWGKDYGQAGQPTNPLGLVIDTAGDLVMATWHLEEHTNVSLVTLDPWGTEIARREVWDSAGLAAAPGGGFASVGTTQAYQANTLDVARYDAAGGVVFEQSFPAGVDGIFPAAIAVDASGNVVVAGGYADAIDFGGGVTVGPGDPMAPSSFVAKLGPDGAALWAKRIIVAALEEPTGVLSVSFDPTGNIFLQGRGSADAVVDLGAGPVPATGQPYDVFVAKLDPTGAPLWAKRFGVDVELENTWGKADAHGDVVLVGSIPFASTTIDFGGGPLGTQGDYVAVLDPAGNYLQGFDAGGGMLINDFALDAFGDVMLVGEGVGALPSDGHVALARYSLTGELLTSWSFGDDAGVQEGYQVVVDPTGDPYFTAMYCGTLDVGSGPVVGPNTGSTCNSTFVGFVPLP